jgi:hypothetical protein
MSSENSGPEPRPPREITTSLAKRWFKECFHTHIHCRQHERTSIGAQPEVFRPTRIIQINPVGNKITSCRLILGGELLNLGAGYVTLSHCWGDARILRLTGENISELHHDIPLSSLPKTFLEAIQITMELGFNYLWIDSLCIVQDSRDDWRNEAASMGSVYRYSVLTIAATGARNSHQGLFLERSDETQVLHERPSHDDTVEKIRAQRPPLNTRAWAVQEHCLSTRTLNFDVNEISWDCITGKATEINTRMFSANVKRSCKAVCARKAKPRATQAACTIYTVLHTLIDVHRSYVPFWLLGVVGADLRPDSSLKRRFIETMGYLTVISSRKYWDIEWWNLLETYTACDLTVSTDRWPAIEGLATEVERKRNKALYHGLWIYCLVDELLWYTEEPQQARLAHEEPSWSWLSLGAPIKKRHSRYTAPLHPDAEVQYPSTLREYFRPVPFGSYEPEGLPWLMITANLTKVSQAETYHKLDVILENQAELWEMQINVWADSRSAGLLVTPKHESHDLWERVGFHETDAASTKAKRTERGDRATIRLV